jgi:hypothetical protein
LVIHRKEFNFDLHNKNYLNMKKIVILTGAFLMTAFAGLSQKATEKKEFKQTEAKEQKVAVEKENKRQNIQLKKAEAKPMKAAKPVAVPASELNKTKAKRKEEE